MQANLVKLLVEMRSRQRRARAVLAVMGGWRPCHWCGKLTGDERELQRRGWPIPISVTEPECLTCQRLQTFTSTALNILTGINAAYIGLTATHLWPETWVAGNRFLNAVLLGYAVVSLMIGYRAFRNWRKPELEILDDE